MKLILTKDDMESDLCNQQQNHQEENYYSSSSSLNYICDQNDSEQVSFLINNKIHHFLSTLMLSQSQQHQISPLDNQVSNNQTVGNQYYQMQSSSSPSFYHDDNNRSTTFESQAPQVDVSLSISQPSLLDETPRRDPTFSTQKKQPQDNSNHQSPPEHIEQAVIMVKQEEQGSATNLDETECKLMLSFTENEMEVIEHRFMNTLYSKLNLAVTQQQSNTSLLDENSIGNIIRNQTLASPHEIQQQATLALSYLPPGWNSATDSSNLSNNNTTHPNPKQKRAPKRKKKPIMTTTLDSTPISTPPPQPYSKLGPPSINTKKVSKKRDRNNSVSDSPTKKSSISSSSSSTTQHATQSVYRGHVSNSNSFSKESPWQFHTYSEGKRNQSENLVFFHFNPKKN